MTDDFLIRIIPVDDQKPRLTISGIKVQEGSRYIVNQFDLHASDNDTSDENLLITITKQPSYGSIQISEQNHHADTLVSS